MKRAVIVGAGLAGLTCARRFEELGWSVTVLESGDAVGGRVRTDQVEGFRLDRGFQVLLTAYPAARRWLDYDALSLQSFPAGAEVRLNGSWERVADPRREATSLIGSLAADIGSFADKLRVLRWAWDARRKSAGPNESLAEVSSLEALRQRGFSEAMIERFWRPWLRGIFLEAELETSSRMLEFVFAQFAQGGTAIPRRGMQAIPEQLAAGLSAGAVELNQTVTAVAADHVKLADGSERRADAVVVATDAVAAERLNLGSPDVTWREAICLYFVAPHAPTADGMLRLNGQGDGVINHLVTLSLVNPAVAPPGQHLVMVGIRPGMDARGEALERATRAQLSGWFGEDIERWRLLRESCIPHALPARRPLVEAKIAPRAEGVWRAGDYLANPSIQGAMAYGQRVAEAVADFSADKPQAGG